MYTTRKTFKVVLEIVKNIGYHFSLYYKQTKNITNKLSFRKRAQHNICKSQANVWMPCRCFDGNHQTQNCLWTRAPHQSTKAGKCTSKSTIPKVNTTILEWPIPRSQCKGYKLRRNMDSACHAAAITYAMTANFAKQLAINVVGKDTHQWCADRNKTLFCDQEVKQKDSQPEAFAILATNYDSSQYITYDAMLKKGKVLFLIVNTGSRECLIKKSTLCNICPKAVINNNTGTTGNNFNQGGNIISFESNNHTNYLYLYGSFIYLLWIPLF